MCVYFKIAAFFPHRLGEWKAAPISKQTYLVTPSSRSYIVLALPTQQLIFYSVLLSEFWKHLILNFPFSRLKFIFLYFAKHLIRYKVQIFAHEIFWPNWSQFTIFLDFWKKMNMLQLSFWSAFNYLTVIELFESFQFCAIYVLILLVLYHRLNITI